MKKFLINALQKKAQKAIRKHKPKVIAVTGSIGKTSTKNAIATVLDGSVNFRTSEKNFNNEIGVPLTILGKKSPGRSPLKWIHLLLSPIKKMPEVILLEFGADHPGDIEALCKIAPPTIGIVTGISSVHVEYFTDITALVSEKAKLIEALPEDGHAILNADDDHVMEMRSRTRATVSTYGMRSMDVAIKNISIAGRLEESFEPGEQLAETLTELKIDRAKYELRLRDVIGYAPAMSAAAAISVGKLLGVDPSTAIDRLQKHLIPTPGRLRPIPGIKGTLIIDDTYNAAPAAMRNGLDVLKIFTPGDETDRRIAVLGAMAELGRYSEDEHRLVGLKVAEVADVFIAVGEAMQVAVNAAIEAGMPKTNIHWFATSREAGRHLDQGLQKGDIVYVKGSQSTRMERVVKDVMAEPLRAKQLLVRQEDAWLEE